MATKLYDAQDHQKNEIQNVRLQQLGADPGSPVEGLILWRSDSHHARVYDGTTWTDVIAASIVTTKGDIIVATGNNAVVRKAAGANGTFLQAQSGQSDGLLWAALVDADIPASIMRDAEGILQSLATTKGDTIAASAASTWARQAVGANNTFYVADSSQANGLRWRAIAASDVQELLATSDLTDWPRSAALDLNGQKLTGVADGTATTDAATFGQLNAILEGKIGKDPVEVASTAQRALSGLAAIDGYTPVAGDRVLLKDQTAPAENGVYVAASGAWARAADMNAAAEFKNGTVLVLNGTVNKGKIFTESNTVTTVGTDAVAFVQTSVTGVTYTADEVTLTLAGTVFAIKALGITNAYVAAAAAIAYSKLALTNSIVNADIAAAAAIAYSKLNLSASIVNADIAAGAAIAASKLDTASTLGRVGRMSSGTLTGGATSEVITHNLNTQNVRIVIRNNASPYERVEVTDEATSVNTITVRSGAVNLPAGYTWTVWG